MLEVNVTANFSLGRHAAEQMASRGGGSITFITSIAAGTPMPNNVAYAPSTPGLPTMALPLPAPHPRHPATATSVAPAPPHPPQRTPPPLRPPPRAPPPP